ncbi:MAG: cupin-like domain-containing protein [Bradymonadaceae bacterium]
MELDLDAAINNWPTPTLEVPRVSDLSEKYLLEFYIRPNAPVILEDVIPDYARELATIDRLYAKEGDVALEGGVRLDIPETHLLEHSPAYDSVDMTLGEFIELLESPDRERPCYAGGIPVSELESMATGKMIREILPELGRDAEDQIWVGTDNANVGLHIHTDVFLGQLHGNKHFFLFHHRHSRKLDPIYSTPLYSPVDPRDPDLRAHPELVDAAPFVGSLAPGDLLYIPDLTWHFLWGDGTNVSRTTPVMPALSEMGASQLDASRLRLFVENWGWDYVVDIARQFVEYGMLDRDYEQRAPGTPIGFGLWKLFRHLISRQNFRKVLKQIQQRF